jgi:hypothetical protein
MKITETELKLLDTTSKIAIAIIGGAWAWLTYVRGRTFRRRLEPKITGQILLEKGTQFLSMDASDGWPTQARVWLVWGSFGEKPSKPH